MIETVINYFSLSSNLSGITHYIFITTKYTLSTITYFTFDKRSEMNDSFCLFFFQIFMNSWMVWKEWMDMKIIFKWNNFIRFWFIRIKCEKRLHFSRKCVRSFFDLLEFVHLSRLQVLNQLFSKCYMDAIIAKLWENSKAGSLVLLVEMSEPKYTFWSTNEGS